MEHYSAVKKTTFGTGRFKLVDDVEHRRGSKARDIYYRRILEKTYGNLLKKLLEI